ncbi:hypothetical protein I5G62_gp69 [Mycobacterium phage CRB2]|uniref:Uncharacterized protein n=1 Tax=Mycobacterium phage CRB2 TaxID=2483623 RepID=A0A455LM28_9CAUD|nr:hypothetical protein I5G62_gp69 [Mycobacterium phage CRB2]AYP70055.1 hypothetical protein CRB2_69 [Mycobacterium phage CRB2]
MDIPEGLSAPAERLHRALLAAERCSTEYQQYADAAAVRAAQELLEAQ